MKLITRTAVRRIKKKHDSWPENFYILSAVGSSPLSTIFLIGRLDNPINGLKFSNLTTEAPLISTHVPRGPIQSQAQAPDFRFFLFFLLALFHVITLPG